MVLIDVPDALHWNAAYKPLHPNWLTCLLMQGTEHNLQVFVLTAPLPENILIDEATNSYLTAFRYASEFSLKWTRDDASQSNPWI